LAAQLRYWLDHEEEREQVALAAYKHCLREHTHASRERQLVEIVQAWLATRLPVGGSSVRLTSTRRPGSKEVAGQPVRAGQPAGGSLKSAGKLEGETQG
jgi:hypothetical protein